MEPSTRLTVHWCDSMARIEQSQWDRLTAPLPTPVLDYQWLHDLEASGSISVRHGWQPCHLTLRDQDRMVAAAPLYIKQNSGGEFIFDHWLEQIADRLGTPYFPKLVGMSPATPSPGFRFLVAEECDERQLADEMVTAIDQFCQLHQIAGSHLQYTDPVWADGAIGQHFQAWHHQCYRWENEGFATFDDYLQRFNASQRRNIRRERQSMHRQGIEIVALHMNDIPATFGPLMYRYYLRTNARYGPWAARFLNGEFFNRIFDDFRHRLLIFAAYRSPSPTPIGLSLLLVKNSHLIGRYWGCEIPVKDLHFNLCFYAPIEWAISHSIKTFDPGIGSSHKLARGFRAITSTSLHRFRDPRLADLFTQVIMQANRMEQLQIDSMNEQLPFARQRPASRAR